MSINQFICKYHTSLFRYRIFTFLIIFISFGCSGGESLNLMALTGQYSCGSMICNFETQDGEVFDFEIANNNIYDSIIRGCQSGENCTITGNFNFQNHVIDKVIKVQLERRSAPICDSKEALNLITGMAEKKVKSYLILEAMLNKSLPEMEGMKDESLNLKNKDEVAKIFNEKMDEVVKGFKVVDIRPESVDHGLLKSECLANFSSKYRSVPIAYSLSITTEGKLYAVLQYGVSKFEK